jgi:hypothetical protein
MALLVGVKVNQIYIKEMKGYWRGFCAMEIPKCPVLDSYITLAGSLGQWLFAGEDEMRKEHLVTTDDYKDLRKRKISEKGMSWLFYHTKKILRTQKKEILRLAERLVDKRKMGIKEIEKTINWRRRE